MSAVRCVDCTHAALRNDAARPLAMVRLGTVRCDRSHCKATFYAPLAHRQCANFAPTDAAVSAARVTYFQRLKEKAA